MILTLVNLIARRLPGAFQSNEDDVENDVATYHKGRDILTGLVQAGNVPSKHHLSMLEEVEAIGNMLSWPVAGGLLDGAMATSGSGSGEIELGFEHWGELAVPPDMNFEAFDPFSSSFEYM